MLFAIGMGFLAVGIAMMIAKAMAANTADEDDPADKWDDPAPRCLACEQEWDVPAGCLWCPRCGLPLVDED